MAGSHLPLDDQPVERLSDLRARAMAVLRDAAVLAVAPAGEDTLRAILAGEGDDAFVMAVAARDLPPPRSERVSAMMLAARRTAAFKRDLLTRAGGVLTTAQVRERLGWRSDRAVLRAAATRRLLAVDARRRKLFPAFQFIGDAVLPSVAKALAAAPNTTAWAMLQFFLDGDEALGEERPIEMLRGGEAAVSRLVRLAGRLDA